jgi:hypothetical protein
MQTVLRGLLCFTAILASAQVHAGFLTLDYTTSAFGLGQFKYDFKLTVTNQDNSFAVGKNVNWIIFGDVPSGPSPLTGFSLLSESFTNPSMVLTSSGGGHNGPSWIDFSNISGGGWIPVGVGDFVTWSGVASVNVTTGLRFSNLHGAGGGVNANFDLANYVQAAEPTPEPASMALLAMGGGLLAFGRKRLSRRQKTAEVVA